MFVFSKYGAIFAHEMHSYEIFMRLTILTCLSLLEVFCFSVCLNAQGNVVELINDYGRFDSWSVREIKESALIGGQTKQLYEFYGNHEVRNTGKTPYSSPADYFWRTNNVLAVVAGVVKTNNTVYPEPRDGGYCARIETHIEEVKALGVVNMDVVCQGALVIGVLPEPIRDTKSPMSKVFYGISFEGKPKSVKFDYKSDLGHETIRGTGFSKLKNMEYPDSAEVTFILQRRWEDSDGRIHALRVATGIERFYESEPEWVNGHEVMLHYGDITKEPFYQKYMGLKTDPETAYHALNSRGENVIVEEDGWAQPGTEPNFMILNFIASCGKAFNGGVGNVLWVDNVEIVL